MNGNYSSSPEEESATGRPDRDPLATQDDPAAVGAYAREHRIVAVPVAGDVIDLGAREAAASSAPHNSAAGYRLPAGTRGGQ
jgi:hypothetical protein